MARKKRDDDGGGYSWMDTYGDMVTLLLTFFVMLFSMSTVDAEKFAVLVKAFSNNPAANTAQLADPEGTGTEASPINGVGDLPGKEIDVVNDLPVDLNQLYEYLKKYIVENKMEGSVRVEKGANNSVYLRFDNNIFFDGDSSVLRATSYDILDFLGDCFKSVEEQIMFVRINGHTAAIPNNLDYHVDDWELSTSRANRVASYFEKVKKVDATKLMTNGYGKNHPIATNDTPEGQAKNRRVDIMILGNDFDTGNAQQLYSILQQLTDVTMFDDKSSASDIVNPSQSMAQGASSESSGAASVNTSDAGGSSTQGVADASGASSKAQVERPIEKSGTVSVPDTPKPAVGPTQ